MAEILVTEQREQVPMTGAELRAAERDEPLYLGPGDVVPPPPAAPPPTLDEIARRAAQIVLEIQAAAPRVAEDAPAPPKPRRIRKTVVRDENNRIKEVVEEEI